MIVFWTMLVLVTLLAWLADAHTEPVLQGGRISIYPHRGATFLALAVLAMVSGLRSGMHDTAVYISTFNNHIPFSISDGMDVLLKGNVKGPGFFLYQVIVKSLGFTDFHFFLFLTAFLSHYFVIKVLYKYSPSLMMSLYLYITMGTFAWTINGIRQFLCATVLFCCTKWIVDGKWIMYFAFIGLMYFFHFSVLLMIPLYFFARTEPWSASCWMFVGFMLLITVFFGNSLSMVFDNLDGTKMAEYQGAIASAQGANVLRVLISLVPVVAAYSIRTRIHKLKNPVLNVCVNFGTANFLLMLLASRGGGLFIGRLCGYTELYVLLLVPYLFRIIPVAPMPRTILTLGFTTMYLVYYYYQMVVTWHSYYISDIMFGPGIIQ